MYVGRRDQKSRVLNGQISLPPIFLFGEVKTNVFTRALDLSGHERAIEGAYESIYRKENVCINKRQNVVNYYY